MAVPAAADECAELQAQELEVVESIYPGFVTRLPAPSSSDSSAASYRLTVPIELPDAQAFALVPDSRYPFSNPPTPTTLTLTHLPPLELFLLLPALYPLAAPPQLTFLRAPFLPARLSAQLRASLAPLLQPPGDSDGVLCQLIEHLRTGEFLPDLLGEDSAAAGQRVLPARGDSLELARVLREWEKREEKGRFDESSFDCGICLSRRKGKACWQLRACGDVFCHDCLSSYFTLSITEGTLYNIACPSPECPLRAKEPTKHPPSALGSEDIARDELEAIVGPSLVERFEKLREKQRLESDPKTTHCPLPHCQAAVPRPPRDPSSSSSSSPTSIDDEVDDGPFRLRVCPSCTFSFCIYCRRSWHGAHAPCPLPATSAFLKKYLALPPGSRERAGMEARYGRKNLERMVRKWEEDEANRRVIEGSTTACPGCGVRAEKSLGCNHMTCARCATHYCHRCSSKLNPREPYKHFNTPRTPCYQQLFDSAEIARAAAAAGEHVGGGGEEADAWADVVDWEVIIGAAWG